LDGSEDDILWEDDGEDKDDSDWVTDKAAVSFFQNLALDRESNPHLIF
jgi:hypothetical protein